MAKGVRSLETEAQCGLYGCSKPMHHSGGCFGSTAPWRSHPNALLAPRVPIAEMPEACVPSEQVTCARCGCPCWSSLSSRMPHLPLVYVCTDCVDPFSTMVEIITRPVWSTSDGT